MQGSVRFSPDGRRLAYVACREKKMRLVLDGVEGKPLDGIADGHPLFSPDGGRLVYAGVLDGKWRLFEAISGRETKPYEKLGPVVFSDDGQHMALLVWHGKKCAVLVGNKEQPEYDNAKDLTFSPDGKRLAYAAATQDEWRMVVDGQAVQSLGRPGLAPVQPRREAAGVPRRAGRAVVRGLGWCSAGGRGCRRRLCIQPR